MFFSLDAQEPARLPMPGRGGGRGAATDFNAYLRIGADGRVTCLSGKVELGQGAMTSLAQMLAEELDVAFDRVDMVLGDTDLCPYDMGTFGSMNILAVRPGAAPGGRGSARGAAANGRRAAWGSRPTGCKSRTAW